MKRRPTAYDRTVREALGRLPVGEYVLLVEEDDPMRAPLKLEGSTNFFLENKRLHIFKRSRT